jgi:CTP:molybdopterin cytidylyltransferase MocA
MAKWTAIILAGQRPGETAFATSQGVAAKALIPVGGEAMLGRVARTLLACPSVGRVVILAQEAAALLEGPLAWMRDAPRIGTADAGEGISESIGAITGDTTAPYPVLVTTADHPLLRPEMVEHFIAASAGADCSVGLVDRHTVEALHPATRRTWLKFADGHFSGANLFALLTPESRRATDFWARVERDRKRAVRLLAFFGPIILFGALTRTLTLDGATRHAGRKFGVALKAVRLPYAEAAIDVDKPADLELAEKILADVSR